MQEIKVILTCHNRCGMTVSAVRSIHDTNPENRYSFIIVDDNSNDDTVEKINGLIAEGFDITLIKGPGTLYYSGGMREGMDHALNHADSDYYLIINDDVSFYDGIIDRMIRYALSENGKQEDVLVGCTVDDGGMITYGGIKYIKGIKYRLVGPGEDTLCDTFNANCVLIGSRVFRTVPCLDDVYLHSLGDFDYGFSISKRDYKIRTFSEPVGICTGNPGEGSWLDPSLGRLERLKLKESPKGAPFKQWFYYLYKNFGLLSALLHGFTPFLRILAGK
ncbi:MAG: glycosyltransferase [Lachnospiraceae bacterium]|nr:glycosyltransferase [Lachnospiraceae bacterium]